MYLFYTEPMLCGPAITRLQEMLTKAGYSPGAIDGWFGPDTLEAVLAFQIDRCIPASGVVQQSTWDALEFASMEPLRADTRYDSIIDTTKEHPHPRLYRERKSPRSWDTITGVTLHQTGCHLAENVSRWDTLNAHIGVFKDGTIVLVNDLQDFIWHAQGLSHNTIGIEFNGNFPGIEGNPRTWWPPGGMMSSLTAAQHKAADVLFKWLREQFEKNGAKWTTVNAHRQSSRERRADPGSEIWQEIAMPWIDKLSAVDGGEFCVWGSGRQIPKEWNPSYSSSY